MSIGSHALGEQAFPPALSDDPVSRAGGGHHHNHSYEAAGEGNYLRVGEDVILHTELTEIRGGLTDHAQLVSQQ